MGGANNVIKLEFLMLHGASRVRSFINDEVDSCRSLGCQRNDSYIMEYLAVERVSTRGPDARPTFPTTHSSSVFVFRFQDSEHDLFVFPCMWTGCHFFTRLL